MRQAYINNKSWENIGDDEVTVLLYLNHQHVVRVARHYTDTVYITSENHQGIYAAEIVGLCVCKYRSLTAATCK